MIGLLLASTITPLKASLILFTNVSDIGLGLNLDLDQYLFMQNNENMVMENWVLNNKS